MEGSLTSDEVVALLLPTSPFTLRGVTCSYGQGLLPAFLWSDCVQVGATWGGGSFTAAARWRPSAHPLSYAFNRRVNRSFVRCVVH